jgi:fructokinase
MGPGFDPSSLLARGARVVLETRGAAGTVVHGSTGWTSCPVGRTGPVVDTIGAGDTFTGAFCAWWQLSGFGAGDVGSLDRVRQGVDAAQAAASVVVARRGADPPHRADLPPAWV